MKSKKLLMALALPVALTACTADDFLTDQVENPALAGREVVGPVTFVAPGADTRIEWSEDGKSINWTETDKLGAALMDEFSAPSTYTISNNLYTNYLYTFDNGSFVNGNAKLVAGNYFVYAQQKEQGRGGLAWEVPAVQKITTDRNDAFYASQMFLDHFFVDGTKTTVEIDPLEVFPVARINAKYEGTATDLVIQKIVLKNAAQNGFGVKGYMRPAETVSYDVLANLADDIKKEIEEGENAFSGNDYKATNLAAAFVAYKKAMEDLGTVFTLKNNKTAADFVNPILADFFVAGSGETDKSGSITVDFGTSELTSAPVLLPLAASGIAETNLTVEIYTNKGLVTISGADDNAMSKQFSFPKKNDDGEAVDKAYDLIENFNSNAATAQLEKAANAISYTASIGDLVSELTAGQYTDPITIKFKDAAILVPSAIDVNSTDELETYLANWYEGKTASIVGGKTTVTINALGGGTVEISDKVLAFIADENNPKLEFQGTVTIPADAAADAIDKITPVIESQASKLTVINKAAAQTWTDNSKKFVAVTNEGALNITGKAADAATAFTANIVNLGTMTIDGNASVSTVTNGRAAAEGVTAIADAALTLKKVTVAELTNHAVVSIEGAAAVTKVTNKETLTVTSGTLTTDADSSNNGDITVAAGATWTVLGDFANNGSDAENGVGATITNNGTISVEGGKLTNNDGSTADASIINNNMLAGSTGTIQNDGYMEANANSRTLITKNLGEIIVDDAHKTINISDAATGQEVEGKVTYIVSEQASLAKAAAIAKVNSLRITAAAIDLTTVKNYQYVEFKSAVDVTITGVATTAPEGDEDWTETEFENVVFTADGAEVDFTVNGQLNVSKSLAISEKAVLTISDEIAFKAAATATNFKNEGTIIIDGTLNMSATDEPDDATAIKALVGTYYSTGGANSFAWKSGN